MTRCSVIIPAYNVERYVAASVESALSQTMDDLEVIVVNDGSTDGTATALQPFMDRIVYLEQENRGPSAARNAGILAAKGTYLALFDADDLWLPDRLARVLSRLERYPQGTFATSNAFLMYGDKASNDTYYRAMPFGCKFRSADQRFWITQYNFIFTMTVFPHSNIDRYGAFDESMRTCEDWDLWMRFILGGERVVLVDEPLGHYRIRRGSLAFQSTQLFDDTIMVLENARGRAEQSLGLESSISLRRSVKALMDRNWSRAIDEGMSGLRDPSLPLSKKVRGLGAGTLSRGAWRLYVNARALSADRRHGSSGTSMSDSGGGGPASRR